MTYEQAMQDLDETFRGVGDPAIRVRLVHEYGTIRSWVGPLLRQDDLRVLDFGCGQGWAATSLALRHPDATVFATDIATLDVERLQKQLLKHTGLSAPENVRFDLVPPSSLPDDIRELDLIYSWSVFEHIRTESIVDVFRLLRSRLKSTGRLFVQIEPLYFSPFGAHLKTVSPEPWVHLQMQTDQLHEQLRAAPLHEGTKARLWAQFISLNRATAPDILDAGVAAGFSVSRQETKTVDIEPPPALLRAYSRDALVTNELRVIFAPR